MEKPTIDKARMDKLQKLEKEYYRTRDFKGLEEYVKSLTMDEILDEMLILERDIYSFSDWKKAREEHLRYERVCRLDEEPISRSKIIKANKDIIKATKKLYDDYMRALELRSKEPGKKRDWFTACAKWAKIDRNYTFGYSHPIDIKTFRDLCLIIYKNPLNNVGDCASFGEYMGGVTEKVIEHDTLEDLLYPRHPDYPDEERSWNELMGLQEITEARICYPFYALRETPLAFQDIYAIKGYDNVITMTIRFKK